MIQFDSDLLCSSMIFFGLDLFGFIVFWHDLFGLDLFGFIVLQSNSTRMGTSEIELRLSKPSAVWTENLESVGGFLLALFGGILKSLLELFGVVKF